jgi:ABC-type amino acid transport substrate-binding protein
VHHGKLRKATITLLAAGALGAVGFFVLHALGISSLSSTPASPLKIGVGRIVPIAYFDENGRAAGFAVDVINEAARREGIPVSWVRLVRSVQEDLQGGQIDLVAAAMATEERKRRFYLSDPWWSEELAVLSRAGRGQPRRLGVQQVYIEFARPYFNPATFILNSDWRTDSADVEAKAVCNGGLDGALITHGELHDLFLNRPEECNGVRLQSGDTAISYGLAIMSRKPDAAIAKRLRKRIDDLVLDGTLIRFAAAHPPIPTSGRFIWGNGYGSGIGIGPG